MASREDRLLKAVRKLDDEKVREILAEGPVDVNVKNSRGRTSLHIAADKGAYEIVKLLIDAGANVNVLDTYGYTPLSDALSYADIVKALLDAGADINLGRNERFPLLHLAAGMAYDQTITVLVNAGADVNDKDILGNTPLIVAINKLLFETVRLLLSLGADPTIKGQLGYTPLMWAVNAESKDMVKILLETGQGINLKNNEGMTALDMAYSRGYRGIANMLEEAAAEPSGEEVPAEEEFEDEFALPELEPTEVVPTETVPKAETLQDMLMFLETPVADFVAEHGDNAVVIHYDKQILGTLRDSLIEDYNDRHAIRYECTAPKGLMVSVNDVTNVPYYALTLTFQALIPLSEFLGVLTSKHTHWKLTKTKDISYSASRLAIGNGETNLDGEPINLVGRDHCQVGTNKTVYSIAPATMNAGGRRRKTRKVAKKKNRRTLKKNRF